MYVCFVCMFVCMMELLFHARIARRINTERTVRGTQWPGTQGGQVEYLVVSNGAV
mgnify:CR=1 FL=1